MFFQTEENINRVFRKKVREDFLLSEYNQIKGVVTGSTQAVILACQSPASLARWAEIGKTVKTAFAFSAGGLSTRTGGLFNPAFHFTIPELGPSPRSFLELKFAAAAQSRDNFRVASGNPLAQQKVIIMSSFQTADLIKNLLEKQDFYRYGREDIRVFNQGVQVRINPNEGFLKGYLENKRMRLEAEVTRRSLAREKMVEILDALERGIVYQSGQAGQFLRKQDGSLSLNPPGHWDFLKWLVLSNTLAELKRDGTELIFYSHLNNPAGKVDDSLKGLFLEKIEEAKREGHPVPVCLILLVENRGEKGGYFVKVTDPGGKEKLRIVENIAVPDEIKQMSQKELSRNIPYFNSGMVFFSVIQLLKAFDLPDDYDQVLKLEQVITKVNAVDVPVYIDVKETEEEIGGVKYIYVGLQLERYSGDLTAIWPWVPVVIPRDRDFIPIKTLDQVDLRKKCGRKNMRLLAKALEPVKEYLI